MSLFRLEYGLAERHPVWLIVFRLSNFLAAVTFTALAALLVGYYVRVELPLKREERQLLTTNAPAVLFPKCGVNFTPAGKTFLPDERGAPLAERQCCDG